MKHPKSPPSLLASAPFADLCRELARRACFFERLSKAELAARLDLHERGVASLVYRGVISLDKAMLLADLGHASPEEKGLVERAWMVEKAKRDAKGTVRRMLRVIERYREETERLHAFLREKGLYQEYIQKRQGWDHDLGLVLDADPSPRSLKAD